MTVAEFVARFPEFDEIGDVSPSTITTAISDAAQFVDASTWGTRYEAGLAYKAADLLATGPFGEGARLSSKDGQTTYGRRFEEMRRALPIRMVLL